MSFCSKCGAKLPEEANYCPKCRARTKKGIEAGVSISTEELKEAFAKIGKELEKAFSTAAEEIEKAFKTARENIKQPTSKEKIACTNCGEKNPKDSNFCRKCGKRLE